VTAVPRPAAEAAAGLLTALGCLLLAAPAGLLWAALAPRLRVGVDGSLPASGEAGRLLLQTDGLFVLVALGAGVVTAVLGLVLGRRHLLGTALGLAVGGLLAAEVARRTGALVGREEAQLLLAAAASGGDVSTVDLPVRLRSTSALVLWPLAALVVHTVVLGAAALRDAD
jgi:hypothetical protein